MESRTDLALSESIGNGRGAGGRDIVAHKEQRFLRKQAARLRHHEDRVQRRIYERERERVDNVAENPWED
ncbi:MAG: hypothetical protein MN733_35365 [Nitrososphaera sp.]|nr:hypothetical protein [Nitrososphaera sp.]